VGAAAVSPPRDPLFWPGTLLKRLRTQMTRLVVSGEHGERTLVKARLRAFVIHALLGSGRALRDVANCRFHISPCERLLSRLLSFDSFVFLPVPTSYVSLPQVQCARLLPPIV